MKRKSKFWWLMILFCSERNFKRNSSGCINWSCSNSIRPLWSQGQDYWI